MGALTIAFDITIVGALALPWVLLIIHLFFHQDERHLTDLLDWVSDNNLQTVAAVLLFAATYTLGSSVSRMAQDFFNDDDLYVPNLLRLAMTEDRMIASVYCSMAYRDLVPKAASHTLTDKITAFQCLQSQRYTTDGVLQAQVPTPSQKSECAIEEQKEEDKTAAPAGATAEHPASLCGGIMSSSGRYLGKDYMEKEDDLIKAARDIFGLQENGLLLKGQDATLRLRQLHDQIMVLRGATFDGLLTFLFCLFAWGTRMQKENQRSIVHWVFVLIPGFILFLAETAWVNHYKEKFGVGPPYMEFSLLVIGLAGAALLWVPLLRALFKRQGQGGKQEEQGGDEEPGIRWPWPALSLLFGVLVVGGLMGWWATEVLYGQQVIYSYDSVAAPAGTSK